MQSFKDISQLEQGFARMIGTRFMIANLKSQKGAKLNGKIGTITGYELQNGLRMQTKINGDQTIYKIKMYNLISFQISKQLPKFQNNYLVKNPSQSYINNCIQIAKQYLKRAQQNISKDRTDIKFRFGLLVEHLNQYQKGNYDHFIECGIYQQTQSTDALIHVLINTRPGCVGIQQFRLKDIFMQTNDPHQAGLRWMEYPISGFCVPCQNAYIQNNHSIISPSG